jgi:hypothetical protein
MVVQGYIPHQRLPHVLGAVEVVSLENIRNTAVESLYHSMRLRRAGFGQSMFNALVFMSRLSWML